MTQNDPRHTVIHASCVAVEPDAGLLIVGAAGSGKSSLALMMMALGALLISDDQTQLIAPQTGNELIATAPKAIQNMIEARGVGILKADTLPQCVIRAVVDLNKVEQERLPPPRFRRLLGLDIPEYHRSDGPYFAAALIQLLKKGRSA